MNSTISIYNGNTGEIINREMTQDEQVERDAQVTAYEAQQQAKAAEAEVQGAQKAALLNRLGITEEEARLLLS